MIRQVSKNQKANITELEFLCNDGENLQQEHMCSAPAGCYGRVAKWKPILNKCNMIAQWSFPKGNLRAQGKKITWYAETTF